MDPFYGSQSQLPQKSEQDNFWNNEQHLPHEPQRDASALFNDASLEPTMTPATTGGAAASSAPHVAPPAYAPPAHLRGGSTDDFCSDGKTSEVPSFEPKTNGYGPAEAIQREIEKRTAGIDAESRKKASQLQAAAESYMKEVNSQHEARLKEKKAEHIRQQKSNEEKQNEYKKAGAIWNGVELMTDLSKANTYSKGTERMRSILKKLSGAKEGETAQA